MAFDTATHSALLVGDSRAGVTYTWGFSNKTWTNLSPASSPSLPFPWPWPPAGQALAYDPALHSAVLIAAGPGYNQTWEYLKGNWIQPHRTTNLTGPATVGAAVYDSADSYLLVFGWAGGSTTQPQTWAFG